MRTKRLEDFILYYSRTETLHFEGLSFSSAGNWDDENRWKWGKVDCKYDAEIQKWIDENKPEIDPEE